MPLKNPLSQNLIVSLYPMTKLTIVACFITISIFIQNIPTLLSCFILLNLLALLSGVYLKFFRTVLSRFLILCALIVLMQGFFYRGETILWTIGNFDFKLEGLLYALKLSLLLLNIGGSILWMFEITSVQDFVLALENNGVSPKVSFVILSTLQMFTTLQQKSIIIMSSQKSRGVETEGSFFLRAKAFVPTLAPLILSALANTEEKALTLEARGFSLTTKKSYWYTIEKKSIDFILPKICIIVTVSVLVGRGIWLLLK